MSSDGYIPFADNVDRAAFANITPLILVESPTPGQTALFNSWDDAVECAKCGGRMVRTACADCRMNRSGPALSRLTHAAGTPWQASYVPGEFSTAISQDIIEDHYKRLAAR